METRLSALLISHEFEGAWLLLQSNLSGGDIIDPRMDHQWASIADQITAHVAEEHGFVETIHYWEKLLGFFLGTIEPKWGHVHKGHIYFRLGMLEARRDFAKAKGWLGEARKEDLLLKASQCTSKEEAQEQAMESSSYVALALLERIEDSDFTTPQEKSQFMDNLFGVSFDAAIRGKLIKTDLVESALATIVPSTCLRGCISLHNELEKASQARIPFACVSLVGAVLESILLAFLYTKLNILKLSNRRDILSAELGHLLEEAISREIFPNKSVQAACQMVHIFRNRLHPGNEMRQSNKLTMRIAITLRVLLELTVLEWSHAMRETRVSEAEQSSTADLAEVRLEPIER